MRSLTSEISAGNGGQSSSTILNMAVMVIKSA